MNRQEQLREIIESFDTAMLLTNLNGIPHGRPMSIVSVDDDEMWFVSGRDTQKVNEVEDDGSAMITMQSMTAYALTYGHAEVVEDDAKLRSLWTKALDVWFPDGPDTDDAVLIRFVPTHGEYWDVRGTRSLRYAAEAAKALWNEESIKPVKGTYGEATL